MEPERRGVSAKDLPALRLSTTAAERLDRGRVSTRLRGQALRGTFEQRHGPHHGYRVAGARWIELARQGWLVQERAGSGMGRGAADELKDRLKIEPEPRVSSPCLVQFPEMVRVTPRFQHPLTIFHRETIPTRMNAGEAPWDVERQAEDVAQERAQ